MPRLEQLVSVLERLQGQTIVNNRSGAPDLPLEPRGKRRASFFTSFFAAEQVVSIEQDIAFSATV